jgi:hypothetical protein
VCVCGVCWSDVHGLFGYIYKSTCARTHPHTHTHTHTYTHPIHIPHVCAANDRLVFMHTQAPTKPQAAADAYCMSSQVSGIVIRPFCCRLKGVYLGAKTRHAVECFVCRSPCILCTLPLTTLLFSTFPMLCIHPLLSAAKVNLTWPPETALDQLPAVFSSSLFQSRLRHLPCACP